MSSSSKLTPKEILNQGAAAAPVEKPRTSSFRFPSFFRSNSEAITTADSNRPSTGEKDDDESGGDEDSGDEDVARKRSFSDDEGNSSEEDDENNEKLEITIPSPARPDAKGVIHNENPIKSAMTKTGQASTTPIVASSVKPSQAPSPATSPNAVLSKQTSFATKNSNEPEGKEGWLYREVESVVTGAHKVSAAHKEHHTAKIWVCLYNRQLLFSDHRKGASSEIFNNTICTGFVQLSSTSEVKIKYTTEGASSASPTTGKKFSFLVKESEYLSLVLSADMEGDRDEWVAAIKTAISGTAQDLENKTLITPSVKYFQPTVYHNVGLSALAAGTIEYPRKSGFLKKTSTGKSTFGMKQTHKRYFCLDSGELRYYEDETMKPSELKDTLSLVDGELQPPEASDTAQVFLNLTLSGSSSNNGSGGRILRLEAATAKIAAEWRDAFQETFSLLRQQSAVTALSGNVKIHYNGSGKYENVRRRFNVHDQLLPEELEEARAKRAAAKRKSFNNSNSNSPTKSPSAATATRQTRMLSWSTSPSNAASNDSTAAAGANDVSPLARRTNSAKHLIGSAAAGGGAAAVKSTSTIELLKNSLMTHFLMKSVLDVMPYVDLLTESNFIPGEVVLWQGAVGDEFFILESGQLEVLKNGVHVAFMNPGKTFGELALLNATVRQATIRAVTPCKVWSFSRSAFRTLSAMQEAKANSERIAFLSQIELLAKLSPETIEIMAEVMTLKTYKNGDKIIRQGDVGDCFYMILSGRVAVSQSSLTGGVTELVKLGVGKYFGELALIDDAPRKASVTAITPVVQCWTLDRINFLSLFGSMNDAVKESIGISMLKKVKILETLNVKQLNTIARCLVSQNFSEGEVIIKQGDIGDSFYLVASGQVSVHVNHAQVAELGSGSFFGEMSLLSNERRNATVTAIEDTVCLVLNRADFDRLLGPLDELIKAESKRRADETANANRRKAEGSLLINRLRSLSGSFFSGGSSSGKNSNNVSREGNALFANSSSVFDLSKLEKLKKLGIGTFGTVYLVQHTSSNKYYAMKTIYKQLLFDFKQESNIFSERDIALSLVDCQHVATLFSTLQDEKSIYFISSFVPGGDLFSTLYSNNKLPPAKSGSGVLQSQLVFYVATVLSALCYMHDVDVVFRDLKPENMIFDNDGYLKLCDCGSAKKLTLGQKSNTLCGTPEYMAPEMVLSRGHNRAVDFWGLGVLIFELSTRSTPFAHSNVSTVYQQIIESDDILLTAVKNNSTLDAHTKSLLLGLLHSVPNTRLGMLRNGTDDIWNHAFFKVLLRPSTENEDSNADVNHMDLIDVLEDDDDIPEYLGNYDFSAF